MQKVILKLDLHDDRDKQKAMKRVSGLSGIDSISMDMKDQKMTVIGDIDPVNIVSKLRKQWHTDIVSVGPAKEPEKKKDEPKKDEPKKDDKKVDPVQEYYAQLAKAYQYHNQHSHYYVRSVEENPNACVIC